MFLHLLAFRLCIRIVAGEFILERFLFWMQLLRCRDLLVLACSSASVSTMAKCIRSRSSLVHLLGSAYPGSMLFCLLIPSSTPHAGILCLSGSVSLLSFYLSSRHRTVSYCLWLPKWSGSDQWFISQCRGWHMRYGTVLRGHELSLPLDIWRRVYNCLTHNWWCCYGCVCMPWG